MPIPSETNKELLLDFIDESLDSLGAVEGLFVRLEADPDDLKLVDSIFRPVHSIKGNAAYFGLMRIKEVAHRLESLLDLVRQGRRRVDSRLCDLLLKGVDALRGILSKVRDEEKEYDDESDHAELVAELEEEAERVEVPVSVATIPRAFYERIESFLSGLPEPARRTGAGLLAQLRPDGNRATRIDAAELDALRIELSSRVPGRLPPDKERIVVEAIASLRRSATSPESKAVAEELHSIASTFVGSAVGLDPLARELLLEKAASLESLPAEDAPPVRSAAPAPRQEPSTAPRKESQNRTMRVSEESVDGFLEQVGELMGLEETFRYLGKRMVEAGLSEDLATDLRQSTEQFGHLSSVLSKGVMELRKTEARPLLQKAPRLARDVADRTGKRIEVRTVGEEIRIDKSYLELLDAPLMHMVRNACDHGIDSPAERTAAGKPAVGIVEVAIVEHEESLELKIADDGRGLDLEALHGKAVELGIVRADAPFGEAEAVAMLFRSGVSTAREVSEISGRGVGMDVVKREIEGAGGRIEVRTVSGKGTVFRIVLPRSITTRISDGFLFRCGRERFVLPMRTVVETFPVAAATISRISGRGSTVFFRDEILRLVEPSVLLQTPPVDPANGVFVRIRAKEAECVLQVDEALGVQRTVVKPVDEFCRAGGIFAGAAMLGDGGLAMVLDEDGLSAWLRGM